ncbi:type IV pilus modification protein PilV [Aeromonas jandaei]|uniref:type IV pilus modification protein PilV n=1 Tax=Aeromonas TaxID=642 RepID=UPI00059DB22D|nr:MULTISPECIES: type IV pilus modification protein PilV [Aeromonas]QXC39305.1 type IV pilus modification protein PilV [Aeromonas sp. FDAARGOS 1410]
MKRTGFDSVPSGFSLLEVMIAAVVLSFGLLGLVAMQAQSKFAGYEARQRTIASWLANDMVERIKVNRAIWEAQSSNTWIVSSSTSSLPSCANADGTMSNCSDANMLALDLYYWRQSLIGSAASGAGSTLNNPVGCIIKGASDSLTVAIFWAGRKASHDGSSAIASATTNACGISGVDLTRRQYVLTTTL